MALLPKIKAIQFDPTKRPWPEAITPWPHNGYQPRDCSWGFMICDGKQVHILAGDYIIEVFGNKYFCKEDKYRSFVEKWNTKYKEGLKIICEAIIEAKRT